MSDEPDLSMPSWHSSDLYVPRVRPTGTPRSSVTDKVPGDTADLSRMLQNVLQQQNKQHGALQQLLKDRSGNRSVTFKDQRSGDSPRGLSCYNCGGDHMVRNCPKRTRSPSPNRSGCFRCGGSHLIRDCPKGDQARSRSPSPAGRACYECGSTEHLCNKCPKRTDRSPSPRPRQGCYICGEGHLARECIEGSTASPSPFRVSRSTSPLN